MCPCQLGAIKTAEMRFSLSVFLVLGRGKPTSEVCGANLRVTSLHKVLLAPARFGVTCVRVSP